MDNRLELEKHLEYLKDRVDKVSEGYYNRVDQKKNKANFEAATVQAFGELVQLSQLLFKEIDALWREIDIIDEALNDLPR